MRPMMISLVYDPIEQKWCVFLNISSPSTIANHERAIALVRTYLLRARTGRRRKYNLWARTPSRCVDGMRPVLRVGGRGPGRGAAIIDCVKYDDITDTLDAHMHMIESGAQ